MHICINYYYYFIKKNTEQNTKWDEDKSVFRLFILNKINNNAHTPNIDGCLNSFFVPHKFMIAAETKINLRTRSQS